MTVNHASVLTKDYFIAYIKLIMNSREYTLIQAKEFAFDFFFKGDMERYGTATWLQFEKAIKEIDEIMCEFEVC
ncbi:hypothetical protein P9436_04165 [Lysinibacillus capsici]|uniref:hypothetical protein n=1 Tax=Lysinibacillus capsici TaxID=2115968 RepID=UPI0001DA5380|nr:hypothetical protein [Lysinibacillus capsici]EFI70167.1 hypothetical protein BFZC1_03087 [Lysinibacillus fusiformis ZC1]MED4698249.1 hypothetical protein [Lysinibacillus capsici]